MLYFLFEFVPDALILFLRYYKIISKMMLGTRLVDQLFPSENFQNYYTIKVKGRDCMGHIAKAKSKENLKKVVQISIISQLFRPRLKTSQLLNQVIKLKKIQHQNICKVLDVILPMFQTKDDFSKLYIVKETGQTNFENVFKQDCHFKIEHIRFIVYQILCGIKYYHSLDQIYFLQPKKIQIDSNLTCKLDDFYFYKQQALKEQKEDMSEQEEEQQNTIPDEAVKMNRPKKGLRRQKCCIHLQQKTRPKKFSKFQQAPQLIFQNKNYNKAVDLWAFGNIFGKLLTIGEILKQQTHFISQFYKYKNAQFVKYQKIRMILQMIGKPTEQQMNFLQDQDKSFIRDLKVVPRQNYFQKLPNVEKQVINILKACLKFNPEQRSTVDEILSSSFFDPIRKVQLQKSPQKVQSPLDKKGITQDQVRKIFCREFFQ